MPRLLALWLCGLCAVAMYYTIPPRGMSPDVYGVALWILSSSVMAVSATILMVSAVLPAGIHPGREVVQGHDAGAAAEVGHGEVGAMDEVGVEPAHLFEELLVVGPVVALAALRGIRTMVLEQNAVPGLAN